MACPEGNQVFTDLAMCALEEHLVRYLLLWILPELAARMWRYIMLSSAELLAGVTEWMMAELCSLLGHAQIAVP